MFSRAILASLVVPLVAACTDLPPSNCGSARSFSLDIGGCAQFHDLPENAATCNISASTVATGATCWFPEGQDISLCFDQTCHGHGDISPDIIKWGKPRGEKTLTVTNLHVSTCNVHVLSFMYCCEPIRSPVSKDPDAEIAGHEQFI
mmetsp:Transcript_112873/g.282593  ORF Transcript_112873/g.282593 Transcript_112873/m.282593 type:complete len:147 (-) Transcript_112873:53-493(-)